VAEILIIDDDVASCRTLELHFRRLGHRAELAHTFESGLETAERRPPDLVILDIRMPGVSGLEGLPRLKRRFSETPVIMITAFHDMDTTIEAMKRGADDYIDKPIDLKELDSAVEKALERRRRSGSGIRIDETDPGAGGSKAMVGRSRAMKRVFKAIGLMARSRATVLIAGESGTGKEMVARALHAAGRDATSPFVAVNCAALVETLFESELFGHERGAFTGAVARKQGKFAQAGRGTVFLDEIGEISLSVQAKLLRVLQEKEFVPVGGAKPERSEARVIAATNSDLARLVDEGRFREDLYYRLQVMTIALPALKDRKRDLDALVPVLLARANREIRGEMKGVVSRITNEALERLRLYDWPGNVRELENVLMKAVAMCRGDTLTVELLPAEIRELPGGLPEAGDTRPVTELSLDEVQRIHVARVLEATGWHRGRACEILKVSRPRLRRLIEHYSLCPPLEDEGAEQGPPT